MRLTRLYLRNYRVYEDPLELVLPAGLVGIYGPNGGGKSALVESIRWTLFGRSRTAIDGVRTSGTAGDCVTEVEFEHESHLYLVRRTIAGAANTVRAEARADGQQVAEGVRDVAQYVQSVIGMDDAAFRASVFAEQKQVAAFSETQPGKRRELVLRLLGITPLDKARDAARADARAARDDYERNRERLPDLDALRQEAASATDAATLAATTAEEAERAASAAQRAAAEAEARLGELDDRRRAYEELVGEGKAVKEALATATERVAELEAELAELDGAAQRLEGLRSDAEGIAELDARVAALEAEGAAAAQLAAVPVPQAPEPPDEEGAERTRVEAETASGEAARLDGAVRAATTELERARAALTTSEGLSGEADCPVCGQELGEAFEQVQQHRAAEVAEAEARLATQREEHARATEAAEAARRRARAAEAALVTARQAWTTFERERERRLAAEAALAEAREALGRPACDGEAEQLAAELQRRRVARDEAQRLAGRLERRPRVVAELGEARDRVGLATGRRQALLDKVKALGFEPSELEAARLRWNALREAERAAEQRAGQARVDAVRAAGAAEAAAERVARGEADHEAITGLQSRAHHLGRLSDLLHQFRNTVVATVGPRLAAQAADLFGELTDHEYDRLEVDADTYEIQIRDAGRVYGMERFSGSETDLANLALRVAISEHVRFQSGGAVGLLVLDEVFGPLDADRKERMLLALERLRGRFRQVLVVTHDAEIKEQLPGAIEVVKLPGRRATARVLAGV